MPDFSDRTHIAARFSRRIREMLDDGVRIVFRPLTTFSSYIEPAYRGSSARLTEALISQSVTPFARKGGHPDWRGMNSVKAKLRGFSSYKSWYRKTEY